jgi:hypothetical protein
MSFAASGSLHFFEVRRKSILLALMLAALMKAGAPWQRQSASH